MATTLTCVGRGRRSTVDLNTKKPAPGPDRLSLNTLLALRSRSRGHQPLHDRGHWSPWASGNGGRQDVTDALRSLMLEGAAEGQSLIDVAMNLTTDDIARHLYTAGRPDPDLVIRTSGEQRIKLPALAERVRPS